MTYSYTQISQYLTCPRRYRHRYLDGWKEKDTRAAILFGRAFERALGALFRREDPGAVLFAEWSACQDQGLHYSNRDSWDRMLRQGIMLLTRFCQDDRLFCLPALVAQDRTNFDGPAELPRVYVKTSLNDTPSPLGANHPPVQTFEELQSAVNRAACGDVIQLNARTIFTGTLALPAKRCDAAHWITLRTSAPDSSLPRKAQG
jgi:hypothetical protein